MRWILIFFWISAVEWTLLHFDAGGSLMAARTMFLFAMVTGLSLYGMKARKSTPFVEIFPQEQEAPALPPPLSGK